MPAGRTYHQGVYWLLTVPQHMFMPYLPPGCAYIRGQLESGANTGYLHWQLLVVCQKKTRLGGIKKVFGDGVHAELTRSDAAEQYVWKDDTAVAGTRFELGSKPFKRNSKRDWDAIWDAAVAGRLVDIPASVRVSSYSSICRITKDHLRPQALERYVCVFVGGTGLGKSRRAWHEAGFDAYPKDPNTKFWDGYQGQEHVVMDEFRGKIDISNILRWTDRYPVSVETKGSGVVFSARRLWITSNLHPSRWYPDLDSETQEALMRRLEVHVFTEEWFPPEEAVNE